MSDIVSHKFELDYFEETSVEGKVIQPNKTENPKESALAGLPKVLRVIGAIVLIGAAASFLFQSWTSFESLGRYYSFLGFSAFLAVAGFACALIFKDDKGARTFLSLSAAFLPIHMAQFGAMFYANYMGRAEVFTGSLNHFQFQPVSSTSLIATFILAMVVLVPVVFSGISSMARSEAKKLTAVFFLSSSLLLLPFRAEGVVTCICLAALGVLFYLDRKYFANVTSLKSFDGKFVRSMIFTPIAFTIGRNLLLYSVEGVILSFVMGAVAIILFNVIPSYIEDKGWKQFLQFISLIPATCSWVILAETMVIEPYRLFDLRSAIYAYPLALVYSLMSYAAVDGNKFYRRLALIVSLLASVQLLMNFDSIYASLTCVFVAVIIITSSFIMKERVLFYGGASLLAVSLVYQLKYAQILYNMSPWLTLAFFGVTAIFASSYIERNHVKLLAKGAQFKERLASWTP